MKQMKIQITFLTVFAILIISFVSCNQNKMRQNEEQVKNKLLEEEQVIAEQKRLEEEKAEAFADSIAKLPKELRLQANRSVDASQPPIVFNIEEARTRVKPIKYSQLGERVRYVKLSHDLDDKFFDRPKALLTNNGIIISALGGVTCFENNGSLKEIVCKNDQLWQKRGKSLYADNDVFKNYKGLQGMPFAIDNKLYYRYIDKPNNKSWLIEYDMLKPKSIEIKYGLEHDNKAKPKGKRRAKFHANKDLLGTFITSHGMTPLDKYHWATNLSKWKSSKSGYFLTVQSLSGDTVSQLKDFDPIKNFTSSVYRTVERNNVYRFKGHLHLRQNFNDTIFRFETVNRVKPIYVIDFGKKKITSSMQGISPKYDLTNKYVVHDILETNQFVFIFYTKDYICPNTAKKGSLLYNCFVYDKTNNKTFHAYRNEPAILRKAKNSTLPPGTVTPQKGIINDLDYGITTWKFQQTEDGRLYKLINGKDIKEHLQSTPENTNIINKDILEKIVTSSKDNDLFLMIIE